jgi:hypothetical protein
MTLLAEALVIHKAGFLKILGMVQLVDLLKLNFKLV